MHPPYSTHTNTHTHTHLYADKQTDRQTEFALIYTGPGFTLISAEWLISGGVIVMDGHCKVPSPMPIQPRGMALWPHSPWMEHLGEEDTGR